MRHATSTRATAARLTGLCALLLSVQALASGGLVLRNNVCLLTIGFYDAHFTAYQPNARGNDEFCQYLPATGDTIIVLDYLHGSLKEVPVDLRIIHDVTGKGHFARLEDVETIDDLEAHTVFYQEPQTRTDGSLTVEYNFSEKGEYLAIVTAGHPTNDNIYTAVFALSVGVGRFPWAYVAFGAAIMAGAAFLFMMKRMGKSGTGAAS